MPTTSPHPLSTKGSCSGIHSNPSQYYATRPNSLQANRESVFSVRRTRAEFTRRAGRAGSGLCSRRQTCSPSQESCPQLGFLQKEPLARRCLSQGDGREMYKNLSQDSQEPRHQPRITWGQWTGDTEVSWSSSDPCWRPDVRGQRSPLASPTRPSTDVQAASLRT